MRKKIWTRAILAFFILSLFTGCGDHPEPQPPEVIAPEPNPVTEPLSYEEYFSKEIIYDYWRTGLEVSEYGWKGFSSTTLSYQPLSGGDRVVVTDQLINAWRTENEIYYAVPGALHRISIDGVNDEVLYEGNVKMVVGNSDTVFFLTDEGDFYRLHLAYQILDYFCSTEEEVLKFRPYTNFSIVWGYMVEGPIEHMGETLPVYAVWRYFDVRDGVEIEAPEETIPL